MVVKTKTDDILCHMFCGNRVKRSQSNYHYLHNEGIRTRGLAILEWAQGVPKLLIEEVETPLKKLKATAGGDREDFRRFVRMLA